MKKLSKHLLSHLFSVFLLVFVFIQVNDVVASKSPSGVPIQPPYASPPSVILSGIIRSPQPPKGEVLCEVHEVEARLSGAKKEEKNDKGDVPSKTASDTPVTFIETREKVKEDLGQPEALLKHVCYYTGLENVLTEKETTSALLKAPDNMNFKRIAEHFFSCVDPRAEYAVLGTLGGDIGEFINALQVSETKNGRLYHADDVNSILQEFIQLSVGRGRKHFYMHTDEKSLEALAKAADVKDPLNPADFKERNRIIMKSLQPDTIGCLHLKGMISNANNYGVRKELVEYSIQAFLNIYFDNTNPLKKHILYVVSKGEAKGTGYAKVYSPDECVGIAPVLVPNNGRDQAVIHHEAHVQYFRQDLTRFFCYRNGEFIPKVFFQDLQKLSEKQNAQISVYTSAKPVDILFQSKWDRWPF